MEIKVVDASKKKNLFISYITKLDIFNPRVYFLLTIVMTRIFPINPTIMTIPKTTGTNRLVNIFNSSFQTLVLFSGKPCMVVLDIWLIQTETFRARELCQLCLI